MDVDTIDTPGAYLYMDSDEYVIILFKGWMVELLVNIDPKIYMKCVVIDKGVNVLYMRLQKYLYVLLSSALIF